MGIQARRRKAAKKKDRARNSKTTAASIDTSTSRPFTNPVSCVLTQAFPEPFDLGEIDSSHDIDDLLPVDIKMPDGTTVRIEYFSFSSADPTEFNFPVGPPDAETVGKQSSGDFYYYMPNDPDKNCLLISWQIIQGTRPLSYWIRENTVSNINPCLAGPVRFWK